MAVGVYLADGREQGASWPAQRAAVSWLQQTDNNQLTDRQTSDQLIVTQALVSQYYNNESSDVPESLITITYARNNFRYKQRQNSQNSDYSETMVTCTTK